MKVLITNTTSKLRTVTLVDMGADSRPGTRYVVMAASIARATRRIYGNRTEATEAFYALVERDNSEVARASFRRHQDGITRALRAHIEAN